MFGIFGKKVKKEEKLKESFTVAKKEPDNQRSASANKIVKPTIEKSFKANGRHLQGVVVSDKMQKTVVVAVAHSRKHPKYQKYLKLVSRFKAHDEKGEYHNGDKVVIQETRPLSKDKRWVVISRV